MDSIEEILVAAHAHHKQGRWQQAEQLYRQILQIDPHHPDALHSLGWLAHQAGKDEIAISLISQAIRRRGSVAEFHNDLGEACRTLGRFADAVAAFRQAVRLDPTLAEANNNWGAAYHDQGNLTEALACYDRAIAIRPEYANAHYNRGHLWLTLGDYARGWPEYEWRLQREEFRRPPLSQPAWEGKPLAGRTLLVQVEQGLGDTLQFIRYAKLVQARGARVIVSCPRKLMPILGRAAGVDQFCPDDQPLPPFDVHAALVSLPGIFKTDLASIPAEVPYLTADPELSRSWRERFAGEARLKVGIGWQGNPSYKGDRHRSIPLARFAPLAAVAGVRLLSLQKGFGSEQLAEAPFAIEDLGSSLDESGQAFWDTAAVLENLDLVITSDTALAHLAGALGVPVWLALSYSPDWRWLLDRTDSPWYPTMRLFRQTHVGDWSTVFDTIASALQVAVRAKAGGSQVA